MRFRGKRTDNGEWIEGYLGIDVIHCTISIPNKCNEDRVYGETFTHECFSYEVHPESVGMSTLQKDKNGTEIFGSIPINGKMSKGGDIVKQEDCISEVWYYNGAFRLDPNVFNPIFLQYPENVEVTGKQYDR